MAQTDGDRPALQLEVHRDGDVLTILARGDLDLGTCPQLESALELGLSSDASRVLLDLDQVVFIDSTGLQTLLRAKRRAEGDGRLRMTRGTGEVAHLFRLTALDMVLPFE